MCILSACAGTLWQKLSQPGYLDITDASSIFETNPPLMIFKQAGTWVLIFTNFVPISLLLTLEVVKLF